MPEGDDDNHKDVVIDRVDDAVVADPNAKTRPTLQSARGGWAWVLRQQRDGALQATSDRRIDFPESANGRGP